MVHTTNNVKAPFDQQHLLNVIHNLGLEYSMQFLNNCYNAMTGAQQREVFGGLNLLLLTSNITEEELKSRIDTFCAESLAGKYYRDFERNSKNYDWISPECQEWHDQMAEYLDLCCRLNGKFNNNLIFYCLYKLLKLLKEEIFYHNVVYAHDFGEQLIPAPVHRF